MCVDVYTCARGRHCVSPIALYIHPLKQGLTGSGDKLEASEPPVSAHPHAPLMCVAAPDLFISLGV